MHININCDGPFLQRDWFTCKWIFQINILLPFCFEKSPASLIFDYRIFQKSVAANFCLLYGTVVPAHPGYRVQGCSSYLVMDVDHIQILSNCPNLTSRINNGPENASRQFISPDQSTSLGGHSTCFSMYFRKTFPQNVVLCISPWHMCYVNITGGHGYLALSKTLPSCRNVRS